MAQGRARGWRYLECRSSDADWPGSSPSLVFYGHALDLGAGEKCLFEKLEGSVRRGIRKAGAAGLRIQFENSLESVEDLLRIALPDAQAARIAAPAVAVFRQYPEAHAPARPGFHRHRLQGKQAGGGGGFFASRAAGAL